jgi:hypothetical protein
MRTTPDRDAPGRSHTYVLVLVVEALTIAALWAFARYFAA